MIANTAFGIEVDTQTNADSKFLKYGMQLVAPAESAPGFFGPVIMFLKFLLLGE